MLREVRQPVEPRADPGVLPELVARVERRLRFVAKWTRTPYTKDSMGIGRNRQGADLSVTEDDCAHDGSFRRSANARC